MPISVNMRTQSGGTISDRKLPKNTGVSIYGKVTGASGVGAILTSVRLTVPETGFLQDTETNAWGDYAFWFVTPNADQKVTLKITATHSLSGQQVLSVPVNIGNVGTVPAESPDPPSTSPVDFSKLFEGLGPVIGWGLVILAILYFLPVILPRLKKAVP